MIAEFKAIDVLDLAVEEGLGKLGLVDDVVPDSDRELGNPPIFSGVHSWNLRGHFQFLGGRGAANGRARSVVVTCP